MTLLRIFFVFAATLCLWGCGAPNEEGRASDAGVVGDDGSSSAPDLCGDPGDVDCRATPLNQCVETGCRIVEDGYNEYDAERDCVMARTYERCEFPCAGGINATDVCTHPDDGGCFQIGQMCSLHPELVSIRDDEAYGKCETSIDSAPTCPDSPPQTS